MSGAELPGTFTPIPNVTPAERALVLARIARNHPDPAVQRELAAALGIGGGR